MGWFERFSKTPERTYTEADMRGVVDAMESAFIEQTLGESTGRFLPLELAKEDIGWLPLGGGGALNGVSEPSREDTVRRARFFARFNPLAKRTISLYRSFTIGGGIKFVFEDENAQKVGNAFWSANRNRSVFSTDGLVENTDRLNVDGEIPFAIFSTDETPTVRRIDPLEIKEFVKNPEDSSDVWGYKRVFWVVAPNGTQKERKLFYWDMFADVPDDKKEVLRTHLAEKEFVEQDNVVIRFGPQHGDRGTSLLEGAMDWARAQTKFMEARASIQQALARFAWDKKVKGGLAAVQGAVGAFASGLSTGGGSRGSESNPAPAPGSVYTHNQGIELTPVKTDTGAGAAQTDGDMLIQMFGMAVGIFPHWFGSGSNAKFSTSKQMELPMLKMMELEQAVWNGIYTDLMNFALEAAGVAEDKRGFTIIWPEIVIEDRAEIMDAIAKGIVADPRIGGVPAVSEKILALMGVSDPGAAMAELDAVAASGGSEGEQAAGLAEGLKRMAESIRGGA